MDRQPADDERAVARWLGVTRRRLRSSARLALGRAPGTYTFHDRIAVRTVESLRAAGVDARRIAGAMRLLRDRAAATGAPIASFRLRPAGRAIVVEQDDRHTLPDGQGLLAFEPPPIPADVRGLPGVVDASLATRLASAHRSLASLLERRGDVAEARAERARADALSALLSE